MLGPLYYRAVFTRQPAEPGWVRELVSTAFCADSLGGRLLARSRPKGAAATRFDSRTTPRGTLQLEKQTCLSRMVSSTDTPILSVGR
jgi:hypothetical protein